LLPQLGGSSLIWLIANSQGISPLRLLRRTPLRNDGSDLRGLPGLGLRSFLGERVLCFSRALLLWDQGFVYWIVVDGMQGLF